MPLETLMESLVPFDVGAGSIVTMFKTRSFWKFARAEISRGIHGRSLDQDSWGVPIPHWTDQPCNIEYTFRDIQCMTAPFRSLNTTPKSLSVRFGVG